MNLSNVPSSISKTDLSPPPSPPIYVGAYSSCGFVDVVTCAVLSVAAVLPAVFSVVSEGGTEALLSDTPNVGSISTGTQ